MNDIQILEQNNVIANATKSQKGFTALELIIVLIVGFSIIALSASKMSELFSSSGTTEAVSSVLGIYSSARALKGPNGYGSDGDDLLSALIDTKTLPRNLGVSGSVAVNEWGLPIKVPVLNGGNGFSVEYPGVPTESCTKLVQQLTRSGNFSSVDAAGTKLTIDSALADVVSACKDDTGKGVEMKFNVNEG